MPRDMVVKATSFPESPGSGPALDTARRRRPGFWGAVAGMAVAVAIGCAVIAMELAGEFGQRASHFRRRADQLQARLGRIEERLTVANREVAKMRRQAAVRAQFNRILATPDGQLVRLVAPDRRAQAHGALAFSPRLAQAVLEVSGLPQSASRQRFAVHWIRRQGAPLLAAEFVASDAGQPDVVVQLAPPPLEVSAVVVSPAGQQTAADKATQPLMRGEIRKAAKR